MQPTILLSPVHAVRLPEESTELLLTLANPGEEPIKTPLPSSGWWLEARLQLTRPNGKVNEVLLPKRAADCSEEGPLILWEESQVMKSFSLEELAPVREPGWYALEGKIRTAAGDWNLPPVRWFVEKPHPMEVAFPSWADCTEMDVIPCWALFHGEREHSLMARSVCRNDPSSPEGMHVFLPERLHTPAPDAHGLMATAGSARNPSLAGQWLAWLEKRTLNLGVHFGGFHTCSLELAAEPMRILPDLLPRPDGGADAFVLRDDGQALWVVNMAGPVLGERRPEEQLGEEDFDSPGSRVAMADPKLHHTIELPCKFRQGAVGHGTGTAEAQKGLVFTVQCPEGIEVLFTVLRGDANTPWSRVFIDHGQLLPNTDPAMVFDAHGMAHIAVLFRAESPDTGQARLTMARMAFGAQGEIQWLEGIGRLDVGPCPEGPVAGKVAFHVEKDKGERRCNWAVLMKGNVCAFGGDHRPVELISSPDTVLQPLVMVNALEYQAIATITQEGALRFLTRSL